jgi:hypothetical protein
MRHHHLKTARMRAGMRGGVMHWRNRLVVQGSIGRAPHRAGTSLFTRLYFYSFGVP